MWRGFRRRLWLTSTWPLKLSCQSSPSSTRYVQPLFGLITRIIFPLDSGVACNSILTFSPSDRFEKRWSGESGITGWKGVWYSTWGMHQGEVELMWALFFYDPQKLRNVSYLFDLIFFRFQLNLERMLKMFSEQLWKEFHRKKKKHLLSFFTQRNAWHLKLKLFFFPLSFLYSQACSEYRWPFQSPGVWLQLRPLQRGGGQHRCVRRSGQKRRQDRVGASWQNLRGQRAGASEARGASNTETVCCTCHHHMSFLTQRFVSEYTHEANILRNNKLF